MDRAIASRYQVLRELGRGAMGVVYSVRHVHTGAHLALKVLSGRTALEPAALTRFRREMRAPAEIRSENVVQVTDADVAPELGGAAFLVMELVDGCDLERLVLERGVLEPREVCWILAQAGRALDKAHAAGIVHRDLKPQNIFLHRRPESGVMVKIGDFGIAKLTAPTKRGAVDQTLTPAGALVGTPQYMSPEQALGQANLVDPPTDVWAFGLIAYRLLAGAPFWKARTLVELVHEMIDAKLVPPSAKSARLPRSFDVWFARSCDRDLSRRWASHAEQTAALARALGLDPSEIGPGSAAPTTLVDVSLWSSLALATTQVASGSDSVRGVQTSDLAATLERPAQGQAGPEPRRAGYFSVASRSRKQLVTVAAAGFVLLATLVVAASALVLHDRHGGETTVATGWSPLVKLPAASMLPATSERPADPGDDAGASGASASSPEPDAAASMRTPAASVTPARSSGPGSKQVPPTKTTAPYSPDLP
jgi:serine/threonine-protein kinase